MRPKLAIALVCLSTVFFTTHVNDVFNLPKLWLAGLGVMVGLWGPKGGWAMNRSRIIWSLFAAAFLASTIHSADRWLSLCGHYGAGWETCVLVLLCWLAFEMGVSSPDQQTLARWMTVAGIIGSGYLILQASGFDPFIWTGLTWPPYRRPGVMGHPVYSGAILALAMPWAASWWSVGIMSFGVAFTGARSAAIACLAVVVPRLWREKPGIRSVIVAFGALVIFAMSHVHRGYADMMRVAQNWTALLAYAQRPCLGWGPATGEVWFIRCRDSWAVSLMGGSRGVCVHSHNLITNILATQGLIGLEAWAVLAWSAWRVASPRTRAALLAMGLFGMFEPVPHVAYVVLAMAVGMDMGAVP